MPEGSLRKGAPTRGPPKHQNKFAFKHNKNSKKTREIKKILHDGLCKRCHEKIEWRKKYRKYKPLSAPAICNGCHQRTVKRAYHTLCDSCAGGRGVCAKCNVKLSEQPKDDEQLIVTEEDMEEDVEDELTPAPGVSSNKESAPSKSLKTTEEMDDDDDEDEDDEDDEDEEEDDDDEEE